MADQRDSRDIKPLKDHGRSVSAARLSQVWPEAGKAKTASTSPMKRFLRNIAAKVASELTSPL